MKATGITRRIDDLGRIVIPKEIRRTMHVREGDPLEIFTDRDGQIILKKYSPVGELGEFVGTYAEVLAQTMGATVCITDKDSVIAAAGSGHRELLGQPVSHQLEKSMEERRLVDNEQYFGGYSRQIMTPIVSSGDVLGAVLLMRNSDGAADDMEQKAVRLAAGFIGKQMECD